MTCVAFPTYCVTVVGLSPAPNLLSDESMPAVVKRPVPNPELFQATGPIVLRPFLRYQSAPLPDKYRFHRERLRRQDSENRFHIFAHDYYAVAGLFWRAFADGAASGNGNGPALKIPVGPG